jgi:hypothetical protein
MIFPAVLVLACALGFPASAPGGTIGGAYTRFNADKCRHLRGKDVEDYGSWRCRGYAGIDVVLSAGDQRMQISFGRRALDELAARQTFPAFNNVYEGTIEWRVERLRDGKARPFATILRWNVRVAGDEDRRTSTGRVLVVTRLNPGGVCHVGYVDARTNANANGLARQIADTHARNFKCGTDKPIVLGDKMPGLTMPRQD